MKKITALLLSFLLLFAAAGSIAEEVTLQDAMGTVEEGIYRNEYLGFGFNGKDGWTYSTQEELNTTDEVAQSLFSEDLKEAMEESATVSIMMVTAPNGMDNVGTNITYLGDMAAFYNIAGMQFVYESQADQIKTYMESAQMTDVSIEVGTITIDGREMVCYRMSYSFLGLIEMKAIQVSYVKEEYLINLTITSTDFEAAEEAAALIFWI